MSINCHHSLTFVSSKSFQVSSCISKCLSALGSALLVIKIFAKTFLKRLTTRVGGGKMNIKKNRKLVFAFFQKILLRKIFLPEPEGRCLTNVRRRGLPIEKRFAFYFALLKKISKPLSQKCWHIFASSPQQGSKNKAMLIA